MSELRANPETKEKWQEVELRRPYLQTWTKLLNSNINSHRLRQANKDETKNMDSDIDCMPVKDGDRA